MNQCMKKLSHALFYVACSCFLTAAPPKVIRTFPENGDMNVKPGLSKIAIVFSQDMSHRGHSICGGGENHPEFVGRPKWTGKRHFVYHAKLKPNHEYQFGVNCPAAGNFKSTRGESAIPYFVRFKTAKDSASSTTGKKTTPKLTADQNAKAFNKLRKAVENHYSYRDQQNVKWDMVFTKYKKDLLQAATPNEFAKIAGQLLASAKDKHIWLNTENERFSSYVNPTSPNADFKKLPKFIPNFKKQSKILYTGQFEDGIGYMMIDSWSRKDESDLEPFYIALNECKQAPGLIIDVRGNGGGSETMAQKFAGCFIDEPKIYAKHVYRDSGSPNGFGKIHERSLKPNKARPNYRGKIAVLTGSVTMSSCEAFVLMMKQVPDCTIIGLPTQGSSGNPKPHNLGNGVTVYLPSWKAMLTDGTCFEGKGIQPDIKIPWKPDPHRKNDPVIDTALKVLRKK